MNIRTGVFGSLAVLSIAALGACSRNSIEAVNLANDGDQVKAVNIDDAISKYEQATKLDPDNHRIAWKLALAYHKKEDWPKVASACAKAQSAEEKANKKKTFANYYFEQGYALEQIAEKSGGAWADAKQPLMTAVQIDPNYAQAYEELGIVLLHLDDEQGALQNFTKAIETKPDDLQYYSPLADLYLRLGYLDNAEQVLKEGLSFAKEGDKHLTSVHSLLGYVYELKGNNNNAVAEYEKAKKACGQCDDHKEVYFNLGSAYAQANRKNEATQQLQSFWKITCKGAQAKKFEDQCTQSQEIVKKLGGSLQ